MTRLVSRTRVAAVNFQAHADPAVWTATAAGDIAAALRAALEVRARARLLVSGGSTPGLVYAALARLPLDWPRVDVELVDERWLPPNDPDSNAHLAYACLLQGAATAAAFAPLVRVGDSYESALAAANAVPPRRVDVAVLGMGGDGHTASLFPGADDLARSLEATTDFVAFNATGCLGAGAWPLRITATPALLARAHTRILLLRGDDKLRVFERALAGADPRELPVRLLFAPSATPLQVHWCS